MGCADLKNKAVNYLPSKIVLFMNSRQLQFRTCKLGKIVSKSGAQRGRDICMRKGELGGGIINKVQWKKPGVQSVIAFYWLGCDSISLAGVSLGKEKMLLPPAG